MKYDVPNRFSGETHITADIDCADDASEATKRGLAALWAVKSGADLSGADLGTGKIKGLYQLGDPDSWYALTYVLETGEQRVRVGCRDKTIAEGRAYWAGKDNRREVLAALDYAEAIAKLRGWQDAH